MTRSKPLRVYDHQIADFILQQLQQDGIEMINGAFPHEISKNEDNTYKVTYKTSDGKEVVMDGFNQVLAAISRVPNTHYLNLQKAFPGIKIADSGKLIGGYKGEVDRVNETLHSVGDCLEGVPELTPVAIKFGRFLANKMIKQFRGETVEQLNFDNSFFPSTIFTYPEYSFVGPSEVQAREEFGADNIKAYHGLTAPLEHAINYMTGKAYMKIVCRKEANNREKVLGMHFVGPHAGEVMQGFAVYLLDRSENWYVQRPA